MPLSSGLPGFIYEINEKLSTKILFIIAEFHSSSKYNELVQKCQALDSSIIAINFFVDPSETK